MNISAKATLATITLLTQHSHAKHWRDLRAFVRDALADAMHHRASLGGAQPELCLLLSRNHLPTNLEAQHQLEAMSDELRHLGVPHAVHQVVAGDDEPATHQLRITMRTAETSNDLSRT
jgi:hypothetical protein